MQGVQSNPLRSKDSGMTRAYRIAVGVFIGAPWVVALAVIVGAK